ncbi:TetR/AcrR family transcriptional regulator [Amycolatopsis saalfeldensis]|uniref:DNA-binding transcriptional regulator, AcrR family n=1 Tax=Amycolatopsis saalfeldensis TaxID=394193 RepID=A0A1H8VL80_9PSEU|nr:TetR/AcrR family transcriptional regulator [Amycolatopsis saalfeldensis]SEP15638.1 DNA-binding transcriptional regulator, AcrR family [Amycolatopsis saalfeldensis]
MSPAAGLRERKKLETHRTLATIAVRLVGERGLDQVTVEDIAAEAGVSARTFFNYFASKEDSVVIAYADYAERSHRLIDRLTAQPRELGARDALVAVIRDDLAEIDAERDEWLTRIRIIKENPGLTLRAMSLNSEAVQPTVAAIARRSGTDPAKDVYPSLVLSAVGAAINAALMLWRDLDGKRPLLEIFDEAVAALAGGLADPH